MILLMLLLPTTCNTTNYVITSNKSVCILNRIPAEIIAAVALHECYNLSKMERWLVMEALVNRVEDNFNNNGCTLLEQLLAPKQFTGLWKYNPEQFKYDENEPLCRENKQMAEYILSGIRISPRRIYYWAGTCDLQTSHGRFVKQNSIKTNNTVKHLFR